MTSRAPTGVNVLHLSQYKGPYLIIPSAVRSGAQPADGLSELGSRGPRNGGQAIIGMNEHCCCCGDLHFTATPFFPINWPSRPISPAFF
jgi:hypothetical protein